MNDRLTDQNKELIRNSASFDAYKAEVVKAGFSIESLSMMFQTFNEEQFEQQKGLISVRRAQEDTADSTEELTSAMEVQGDATRDLRGDQERLKQELKDLHNVMDASIKQDFVDLQTEISGINNEIEGWTNWIVFLENQKYLTPEQQKQLENYKEQVAGAQDKVRDLQEQWDEQTSRMIFNLAEQQLAIDGFTQEELDALAKLAGPEGLGLVDEVGQSLISLIGEAGNALAQQGDQSDIFASRLRDAQEEVNNLSGGVDDLSTRITGMQDEKVIRIGVELVGDEELFEFRRKGIGFQHGGQFEVTGRPGPDRVPVRAGDQVINAQHGETVTVTPAGVTPPEGGGGGGVTIENVNLNNAIDLSMFVDAIGNM
jgi:hypothetical protein